MVRTHFDVVARGGCLAGRAGRGVAGAGWGKYMTCGRLQTLYATPRWVYNPHKARGCVIAAAAVLPWRYRRPIHHKLRAEALFSRQFRHHSESRAPFRHQS